MTPLQQTALDFCREVLEWEDVEDVGFYLFSPQAGDGLQYERLDAVMVAVRGWCDRQGAELMIACSGSESRVNIIPIAPESITRIGWHPDIRHALLTACLEANRKLKALSHA